MPATEQMGQWLSHFGRQYTARNDLTFEELEAYYRERYGLSRTELNRRFLANLDPQATILEVGCNVGGQLGCLRRMGFRRLWGLELQGPAVRLARMRAPGLLAVQASALAIPFADRSFDLVFTSGVLIHIHPQDIGQVMAEAVRCTRQFIWGFEYYAPEYAEIPYRGQRELLWKADFAQLYRDHCPDLKQLIEFRVRDRNAEHVDAMFLLEKVGGR